MGKDDTFANSLSLIMRTTVDINGKNKRIDVDAVEVPFPTLHDADSRLPEPDKWAEDEDKNKTPVYENESLQWVQDAMLDAVRREARNVTKVVESGKDEEGNIQYKLEYTRDIPATFGQLCEEHKRQGGEYLKIRHEAIAHFTNWLQTLDKSQGAMDMAKKLFSDPVSLDVSPINTRQQFLNHYLSPYIDNLSNEQSARFENIILKVTTAAQSEESSAEDF